MNVETMAVKIGGDPYFATNCYLVSTDAQAAELIAIDPGDQADLLLQTIGTRKLTAIILTHGHFDHMGAVHEMVNASGCKVYAHTLDVNSIRSDYKKIVDGFFSFKKDKNLNTETGSNFSAGSSQPPITNELQDGDMVAEAGLELTVIHTPGHTPGSICLHSATDGLLFSGDTLFKGTCGRTDFEGGSPQSMHDSLARLAKLPPQTLVYPGHDASTTINNELTQGLSEY